MIHFLYRLFYIWSSGLENSSRKICYRYMNYPLFYTVGTRSLRLYSKITWLLCVIPSSKNVYYWKLDLGSCVLWSRDEDFPFIKNWFFSHFHLYYTYILNSKNLLYTRPLERYREKSCFQGDFALILSYRTPFLTPQ